MMKVPENQQNQGLEFPNSYAESGGGRPMIVCIPRTNNAKELAEIYTAADFFACPTYEDNYPTVNLEAQACGTFVITYDSGGSRETLFETR